MTKNKLGFIPVLPPVRFPNSNIIKGNTNMLKPQNIVDVYNMAPTPAKAYARKFAGDAVQGAQSKMRNKFTDMTNPPPPSTPTRWRGDGGVRSIGYGLSTAPNPAPVSLNTGIKPNTYVSDYIDATENVCSPFHVSAAQLVLPSDSLQALATYFQDIVIFDMQSTAQSNISFNLNISTVFSTANVSNAMNNILFALQIYYWYSSIITYHSDALNKNEGLLYLRRQISATDIENLSLLKLRLEGTPIPPNMLNAVRYLSSNWFSGDTQGSPILKIAPQPILSTGINNSALTNALTNLITTTNDEVFSLMRKAFPQWSKPVLSDVPLHPTFDKNFLTIFVNLPFKLWNGSASVQYPQVATKDETINYNSFTNELDGFAFSMLGVQDTTAPTLTYPGLMVPSSNGSATGGSTRKSYYNVSGSKTLYDANAYSFLIKSRDETYYVTNTTTFAVSSAHTFGTDKCQGVSANTIKETSFKAVDYLFDLKSIKNTSSIPSRGGSYKR